MPSLDIEDSYVAFLIVWQCMEDAGCALPMVRELAGSIKHVPTEVDHHHGTENCGHDLIAHGDHFDCLVPLHDGSYMLSHAQRTETGNQKFIEHGRLVKVGETLGKLKRRPKQLLDLFSFESPRKQGYEILSNVQTSLESCNKEKILKKKAAGLQSSRISKYRTPKNKVENQCCTEKKEEHWHDTTVTIPKTSKTTGLSKTTIDVMGICCPNEVPLIKKLLEPIPGVEEVSVNVTSKTVTVLHDQLSASSSKLGERFSLYKHLVLHGQVLNSNARNLNLYLHASFGALIFISLICDFFTVIW